MLIEKIAAIIAAALKSRINVKDLTPVGGMPLIERFIEKKQGGKEGDMIC